MSWDIADLQMQFMKSLQDDAWNVMIVHRCVDVTLYLGQVISGTSAPTVHYNGKS